MIFKVRDLSEKDIEFVSEVYSENIEVLHGALISLNDWKECFCSNTDDDERNFIVLVNNEKAAWLKLNGLHNDHIYISMLVVRKKLQHRGVGTFAVRFAENFAKDLKKNSIFILTTDDNLTAKGCYEKLGYTVDRRIRYTLGDGIEREGVVFRKEVT